MDNQLIWLGSLQCEIDRHFFMNSTRFLVMTRVLNRRGKPVCCLVPFSICPKGVDENNERAAKTMVRSEYGSGSSEKETEKAQAKAATAC
ncbi:hypothetical protein M3221_18555 [Domibacillus indicus]|uniref:hypothetical protein n=1 Tax=Domibacillus indicus TaxID=1437523 RepID=UPI00203C453F|nr:hypothetical protein [Domibacillus indicus]MCM3790380.1 hypothetical protein [Domibacillus indicus]